MRPIIKWPGGKSGEIDKILPYLPEYERYIEPFFGGGALYFQQEPRRAAVNDISADLMDFYRLVQARDSELEGLLLGYDRAFRGLLEVCGEAIPLLLGLFRAALEEEAGKDSLKFLMDVLVDGLFPRWRPCLFEKLGLEEEGLKARLSAAALDKLLRTVANHRKRPFPAADLRENLLTGFAGGFYLYARDLFNDYQSGRKMPPSLAHRVASFYWIREYCYGSMFRYNRQGDFNIPYGGMSYNRKDFRAKVEGMFSPKTARVLAGVEFCCGDFEDFLETVQPTERDFLFLDPPYDTDFNDYEGKAFGHMEQERLAAVLGRTPAKFLLLIKNTPFIYGLYEGKFHIRPFDNRYTYNVRSRNDRSVEHLIITNYDMDEQEKLPDL